MKKLCVSVLLGLLWLIHSINPAGATVLYWSANGTTLGGAGTWNVTTTNWGASSGGPFDRVWTNANSDSAIFDTTAGAVVVGANITVNNLTTSLSGYSFTTGNKITFSGTGAGVNANHSSGTTTLSCNFGSSLFTKSGAGRLELNNSSQTITKYIINGGFVAIAALNRLGAAPGSLVQDYLTLDGGGFGTEVASPGVDLGANRGVKIGVNGAFFGASSSADPVIISAPIIGTNGGTLRVGGSVFYTPFGACILALANPANSYDGPTTVSSPGTLRLDASNVLPDTTTLTLSGGSLDVQTNSDTVGNVIVSSSSSAISGSGTLTAANFDLRASGTIAAILAGNANLVKTTSGNVTLNAANTYSSNTTNGGTGTININGTGRFGSAGSILNLTGGNITLTANRTLANTLLHPIVMTADTTIQNGSAGTGAILFRHGGSWSTLGGTLTIKNTTSTGAGSFDVILTNGLNFTQPIVIGASGDTLPCQLSSFNLPGNDQTFSGQISGYGTFRRSVSSGSGGRTIFTSDNTYTGGTIVNAGTVLANNPGPGSGTGSGTVTVGSGGTLGGTGTIGGPVVVNTSGSINAGSSAGILTLQGGLNLSGGGTNVWELASPTDDSTGVAGTDFDQIVLNTGGELDLSGNSKLLLKFIGTATAPYSTTAYWQSNHTWTIVGVTGPAANTTNLPFASIVNGLWNAGSFSNYVDAGGNILLTFTTNAASLPVIATQPQSRTNSQGSTATFLVTAFGTDPEFYQWYFQNVSTPIANATNSILTKTNVQPVDEGGYFVIITNSLGSATSSVATLTVIIPPTITAQPLGVSTNVGANATFSVTAAGTSPFAYQWYLKGTTNPVAGGTTASLTKTNVQPVDAGNYFVIVTNFAGSATSSNALLIVILPRPTIQSLTGAGTPNVVVSWDAIVGGSYQLQYNTNLSTAIWYVITNIVAPSTTVSVTNITPAGDPLRFYRVLTQ